MNKDFILDQENELRSFYQKKWDAHNVYAKYIGRESNNLNNLVFCVFQINPENRSIVKNEHVAILGQ